MVEALGIFTQLFAGWLFLLSPTYRRRTLARWGGESGLSVMQDVVGGVASIALSLLIPLFVWGQFAGS
ncbi:MAG TPA: hypothetical protein VGF48_25370 [Thermoanaerobaculia bacterium]|jgi:hypothetical protein